MITPREANVLLTKARLSDGRAGLDADRAEHWADVLNEGLPDMTIEEALRALVRHQARSDYVPLPSNIVDRVQAERDLADRPARLERQRLELEEFRGRRPLTDEEKAEADRAFQEALAKTRAERATADAPLT